MSQISVVVPIRLKNESYAILSSDVVREIYCLWDDKTSPATGNFPLGIPETATKGWYRNLVDIFIENYLQKTPFVANWFVLQI